ncbi:nuclear hormone receptor HR96-like isoform X3 [Eriocheir sinensis]|nr:nuclear hormone receptor HR96-like isoform X3 [Eriocheir sinensis]XP_050685776.1 nuclear hormone receptor HR96-like isoform X3 [Eriocheir sinensis]
MAVQHTSPSPHLTDAEDDFITGGKRQEAKKCGVCGDRALGYNFNAITCESCKAFFRRNALKNKEFRCPFQGQCRVDQVTRRFCQKCRLRKCLEIGMKKEWIMTDEEKRRKKQKIEENRARKIGDIGQDDVAATSHDNINNNSDDNNGVSVISTMIPPSNTASPSSSSPSSFPSMSSSSCKPQAVVVGRIREEETHPIKVPRLNDATDVHHYNHHNNCLDGATAQPGLRECDYLDTSPLDRSRKLSSEACSPPLLGASSSFLGSPLTYNRLVERNDTEVYLSNDIAMDIKKEVEYSDEPATPTLPLNQTVHLHHPSNRHLQSPTLRDSFIQTSLPQSLSSQLEPAQPPCHSTSAMQANLDQDCDVFSVREAMGILHPEERNTEESSSTTAASVLDALLDTAISAEFSSPLVCRTTPVDPQALTEVEHAKLDELSEANKGILAPLCEDYNFKDLTNPSLINIINLTEIVIRRLIKMAKKINAFKSLCQEDQIALLKGGCTEMMLLHSVCAYDPDKDSWKIQQDHSCTKDIKLKVLKAAPGNVYEEHKRFVLAFEPKWKQDPHIIFLLCAITLFNPQRQHIIHAEAIRHEQGSYLYLTRRYLEARYGTCAGRATYKQLLHRLAHLHHLSEDHLRLFLEVNPTQVEPLLIEIFDLKHR